MNKKALIHRLALPALIAAGTAAALAGPAAATDLSSANISVVLAAQTNTVPVGDSTLLTAIASRNVGGSQTSIEIYDQSTHRRIADCASGTTCSVTVSQAIEQTDQYVAYVADGRAGTPAYVRARSAPTFVTWSDSGYLLSVTAQAGSNGQITVLAVDNKLPSAPYGIRVFKTDGELLASCPYTAPSCGYTGSFGPTENVVAFIADDTDYASSDSLASSNTISPISK